jgi:hypothetical protein
LLLPTQAAYAATVLFCPLDTLEGWTVHTLGPSQVAIGGVASRTCASLSTQGGTALLSRELPLAAVRGCHLTLGCLAMTEQVVCGPQACSTAKLHLAVRTPRGVQHHHARLTGTTEWHEEGFSADIPDDAQQVLLNLGLESCRGRAMFSRLLVQNDRRGVAPLRLAEAANADHTQLGLLVFPPQTVTWQDIPFQVLTLAAGEGTDCLRLRGTNHPDWPVRAAAIPVQTPATAVYILHGALNGRDQSESPCAIWTAQFGDGQEMNMSIFEGRDIGRIGAAGDLENWHVAWRRQDAQGNWVSFGVTKWTLHYGSPVQRLSCHAYQGAAPVVLAVTDVEEPPKPKRKDFDDEVEQ